MTGRVLCERQRLGALEGKSAHVLVNETGWDAGKILTFVRRLKVMSMTSLFTSLHGVHSVPKFEAMNFCPLSSSTYGSGGRKAPGFAGPGSGEDIASFFSRREMALFRWVVGVAITALMVRVKRRVIAFKVYILAVRRCLGYESIRGL